MVRPAAHTPFLSTAAAIVDHASQPASLEPTVSHAPVLPLRDLLDLAGQLLRGLPAVLWVEATVIACRQGRVGHTLELTEAGAQPGQGGTLRAFLPTPVLARLAAASGGPIDPTHLVGMTTTLKLEPSWTRRYHLGARVIDLSREATVSLARQRVAVLRQALRAEALYDRQRRLPAPLDVTRIAVVHPAGAAGHSDIAAELTRWETAGLIAVRTHPVPFEGSSAPQALASALREATHDLDGHAPDLILMIRGGGAKAGLEALDHETVVRAVALCPVPIVAGVGHAIDNDLLATELAWRNCDTPSKAVLHVAEMIRAPALRARAHLTAIASLGLQRLAEASAGLDEGWAAVLSLADRQGLSRRSELDALWADLRVAMTGAGARCQALAMRARQELSKGEAAASIRLDESGRTGRDHLAGVVMAARQTMSNADGGGSLWQAIRTKAASRLDIQESELAHLDAAVATATRHRLDRATEAMASAEAIVTASSVETALGRGFVLAIDPTGRVVRTVASARAARDLTLLFHDGDVAAVVKI